MASVPEKLLLQQTAESAQIPGKDGYLGILPGHAALLSELAAGTLTVTSGGHTQTFTVSGGYVESFRVDRPGREPCLQGVPGTCP